MFKIVLFIVCIPFFLSAETAFYTIKLATYKKRSNVEENILKLDPYLQKNIVIDQGDDLMYKVSTQPSERTVLKKKLLLYRKVFKDAFIASVESVEKTDLRVKRSQNKIDTNLKKINRDKKPFYEHIKQQTFYVCSRGKIAKGKKFIVKVAFKKDLVSYIPEQKEVSSIEAYYKVKNEKLYFYNKESDIDLGMFDKLEKVTKKYILISSWEKNKKFRTRRYYFDRKDAKKYLESL